MRAGFSEKLVTEIATKGGFEVVARAVLDERTAQYLPVPQRLELKIRQFVQSTYPGGLFAHQANALEALLDGSDVCLATSTASGKSLVFMAYAAHLMLKDPSARILALYPARALIQDQTKKWEYLLSSINVRLGYIDGGVPTDRRLEILLNNRVVLMTPDVAPCLADEPDGNVVLMIYCSQIA